jgi:plasmid stabilization system protein ParE
LSYLIWTLAAQRDVQRAYYFLAAKSPAAGSRAVQAIRAGLQILKAQPGAGRPADKMPQGYREWLIGFGESGYVALYQLRGDAVVILAIRHQRQAGYS